MNATLPFHPSRPPPSANKAIQHIKSKRLNKKFGLCAAGDPKIDHDNLKG
ncbi:hypothetical protein FVEN_g12703 [Fusarium venenatum]|nr:hypothetical protein FVEN_g12703 [Fusarium venenatum]